MENQEEYNKVLQKKANIIRISKKSYGLNLIHDKTKQRIFARIMCHGSEKEDCS